MRNITLAILLTALCGAQTATLNGIDTTALDTTCKPCQDFYRYATGGWQDKNPIPADRAAWGTFQELNEANLERMRTILEASAAPGMTGDQKRLGDFYSACMNTEAIDAAGAKPLDPELARIAAIGTRQNLVAYLTSLQTDGPVAPLGIVSEPDPEDANRIIAAMPAGGLSLPERDYYFRDDEPTRKIREAFLEYVAKMSELLGDKPEVAAANAKTVFDFESTLAKASLPAAARRDPYQTTHKMDFEKLKALAPVYDWQGGFALLKISTSIPIDVEQPDFVKAYGQQIESAPLDTWKTWLRWRLVNDRASYLEKPFFDESFWFHGTVLTGTAQQRPRWKTCVAASDVALGDALGKLYMVKYFPPESQRRMAGLIANLRTALGKQLQEANWLAPETRANALRKLDTFDARIGGTVKWRSYGDVEVDRGGYLAGKESTVRAARAYDVNKIGKPTDRTEWEMTPPTVNAYYDPQHNNITFPAGFLQPPLFDPKADDAENYGAIGAVIGHEMGHGFDDQGAKFDADGNLKDWWTAADKTNFHARAACIVNQFDSIDVGGGQHHNGKLVTGEAMGDLGGLRVAYEAYHESLHGKAAPVIGGFTGDQRFFLAFARVWAGNQRPAAAMRQLATNRHPLAKYRVNATLQNMPEFHAAFQCRQGDEMVRPVAEQCRLW
ncbi:MAG TPA: M13 family metallopeptidase [Bryobacteraceae bacterium]|nr:M13 family metallopeptidase [Bryobacteraceae bacterium]